MIDLGPGAGDEGGQVVAAGPPEKVAHEKQGQTAKYLHLQLHHSPNAATFNLSR